MRLSLGVVQLRRSPSQDALAQDGLGACGWVLADAAFPQPHHRPASLLRETSGALVTLAVLFQLLLPQGRVRSGELLAAVLGAPVEEVAINKDGDSVSREDEVWRAAAGEARVQPEPGTGCV